MPSPTDRPKDPYLSWWIWLVYAVLVAAGIPWYWPKEDTRLLLGLPAWTAVAIVVSVLISAFTAWLLRRPWPDEDEQDEDAPA